MCITPSHVIVLVATAILASPAIAQSPPEVPSHSRDQESEEKKEQRIEEEKALMEELFNNCDKDNNDALSMDEYVDLSYELMVMQTEKFAPSDVDLSTLKFAEKDIKRQIREGLEPDWAKLGPNENGEIPKEDFFKSILGEDYEDQEESTDTKRTNLTRDEEGIDSNENQEPASNEPRKSDTIIQ